MKEKIVVFLLKKIEYVMNKLIMNADWLNFKSRACATNGAPLP